MLTVLFAAWFIAFGYSFVAFIMTEATGSGFTRGSNRVLQFLGWQGVAGVLSVAIFGVSRHWQRGSGVRVLGVAPLGLALCLVIAIFGVIAWARLAG